MIISQTLQYVIHRKVNMAGMCDEPGQQEVGPDV